MYVELANCYINNDDINKAIKCLEKYRENGGENIEILVSLAEKYIRNRDFDKAKELLKELKIKDDKNEKINELLSNIEYIILLDYLRYEKDKIENVDKIYEDIERKYPKDRELYVELANCYINNNDVNNAIKCLEKYRENGGEDTGILTLLSKKYIDVENFEEAERLLEEISKKREVNLNQKKQINNLLLQIKINIRNNNGIIKEKKVKIINVKKDSKQINYNKNIVYKIFEGNISIKDILIKINDIISTYGSNIKKSIFDDFLKKILEKNLLREQLLVNFIYDEINKDNTIFYHIIKRYKETNNYFELIEILCCLIEVNDTSFFIINELSFLLNEINNTDKKKVVELLMLFYSNSKKPRAKNIFLNEAEILQQKTKLKSKPREIDVTVTLRCNLKCIMCNVTKNNNYEIDEYIYDFLLHNIKYLEKIVWKGGEVFLYKNFLNLLKMASDSNVKQAIITNGLLLNEEIIEMLCKGNIDLSISIDAVEKELYERIRVGGNFNVLLKNIDILKKYKKMYPEFSYSMSVVLMNINYKTIDDMINFASYNGFDGIYFMKCDPSEENKYLLLNDDEIDYIKNKIAKYQKTKINIGYDIAFQILKDNKVCVYKDNNCDDEQKNDSKETVFCLLPWKKIGFEAEREISFDCHCRTIKLDSDVIWNNKKIVEYRQKILKERETACKIFLEKQEN